MVTVRFTHSGCPGPCTWSVDAAPIGTTQWRTIINPPDNQVNHDTVLLVSASLKDIPSDPMSLAVQHDSQIPISC